VLHWQYEPAYSHYTHAFASHLRLDTLFCGVAISYAYHFHTARFTEVLGPWRRWLIAGGVMLLSPAFMFAIETTPFIFTLGFTVFYLGSGMALIGILLCSPPRNWLVASLVTLGTYSYSIYLWHLPMASATPAIARFIGTERFSVRYPIYLIGSFALGTVMSRIIEVPALRLRDRWLPSRTKARVDVAIHGAA
jgi:peptidoglycan/LPS O-acetylase OafA/YrhL